MVFARGEVRIAVYNDGNTNQLPTGFEADVEGMHTAHVGLSGLTAKQTTMSLSRVLIVPSHSCTHDKCANQLHLYTGTSGHVTCWLSTFEWPIRVHQAVHQLANQTTDGRRSANRRCVVSHRLIALCSWRGRLPRNGDVRISHSSVVFLKS